MIHMPCRSQVSEHADMNKTRHHTWTWQNIKHFNISDLSFSLPPNPKTGKGGHGNRSNPATYPKAYDRSNQTTSLDIPCTDAERETRLSNRMFPRFNEKVKRAAAWTWVTRLLNSCNMSSSSLMVFEGQGVKNKKNTWIFKGAEFLGTDHVWTDWPKYCWCLLRFKLEFGSRKKIKITVYVWPVFMSISRHSSNQTFFLCSNRNCRQQFKNWTQRAQTYFVWTFCFTMWSCVPGFTKCMVKTC